MPWPPKPTFDMLPISITLLFGNGCELRLNTHFEPVVFAAARPGSSQRETLLDRLRGSFSKMLVEYEELHGKLWAETTEVGVEKCLDAVRRGASVATSAPHFDAEEAKRVGGHLFRGVDYDEDGGTCTVYGTRHADGSVTVDRVEHAPPEPPEPPEPQATGPTTQYARKAAEWAAFGREAMELMRLSEHAARACEEAAKRPPGRLDGCFAEACRVSAIRVWREAAKKWRSR